ncbi:MAG: PDDEXK nuclease domain-containing protein [Candidatus Moraniibacteriota bacterium]
MKIIIDIQQIIRQAQQTAYQSINTAMLEAYWLVGKRIVEEEQQGESRATYGKATIKKLSQELQKEFGKGFSERNIEQMRVFFLAYPIPQTVSAESPTAIQQTLPVKSVAMPISETVSSNLKIPVFKLSWSHYQMLLRISDKAQRAFYEIEADKNQWSVRELKRQFDSALYLRLSLSKDKEGVKTLAAKGQILEKPQDAIKDPYVLEFLNLKEHYRYSENDLENELIDKLELFLLELGKGFTFVARQKRISFEERHFYVDLVFYNRILKCFVIIDLKIGDLKHQDLGQMQMYVNYFDRFVKLEDENKTIGIVLCQDKSETLVEITLPENNEQIFASRYQTVLPSKEDLKKILNS